jgi:colanic acid/amylovoran biosynthesis protein
MFIEVTGVSTRNKGAELMLIAVQEHYLPCAPAVRLAVDHTFGEYSERARYGLWTRPVASKLGWSAWTTQLMPRPVRNACGLVLEKDIDVVIDAAGFAFGGQLGPRRCEKFASDVRRWKQQGKKIVLLPQALGPFDTPRLQKAFREVLSAADLVYARDRASFAHCAELEAPSANLRLAPDFTNLVAGELPPGFEPHSRTAYIVPNHRMVEKTDESAGKSYLPFLTQVVQELRRLDLSPSILLHDVGVDETLVEPLQRSLSAPIPVLREPDPRRLKGILGCARVVVGSRFHALVGALSQGVPCLGVGWSHKYEMLFEDYGCAECLVPLTATCEEIRGLLSRMAADPDRSQAVAGLQRASAKQLQRTIAMWSEVDALLGIDTPPRQESAVDAEPVDQSDTALLV